MTKLAASFQFAANNLPQGTVLFADDAPKWIHDVYHHLCGEGVARTDWIYRVMLAAARQIDEKGVAFDPREWAFAQTVVLDTDDLLVWAQGIHQTHVFQCAERDVWTEKTSGTRLPTSLHNLLIMIYFRARYIAARAFYDSWKLERIRAGDIK